MCPQRLMNKRSVDASAFAIRKAVVTAAAPRQNRLPLQQLVDRDGQVKTVLEMILQQCTAAGIDSVCVVIRPGDEDAYRAAAGSATAAITFAVQSEPLGYAHAILCAKDFVGDDPFLHSVGDHVYRTTGPESCVEQLVAIAADHRCTVSAVQPTRENRIGQFGIVAGPHLAREDRLYSVATVAEKPTPTQAERDLVTPGLRSGHYLGFFGLHVLTPTVMELLSDAVENLGETPERSRRPATLSDALARMPGRATYLAARLDADRYNLGDKYGLLKAQLAIAMVGRDRDRILSDLVELLAEGPRT